MLSKLSSLVPVSGSIAKLSVAAKVGSGQAICAVPGTQEVGEEDPWNAGELFFTRRIFYFDK
jgi:hypothetical protein